MLVLSEKAGPQYQLSTNTDVSVPWVHCPTTSATLRLHPIRLSHLTRWKDPLHSHHSWTTTRTALFINHYLPSWQLHLLHFNKKLSGRWYKCNDLNGMYTLCWSVWHSCHKLPACIPDDSHSFLNYPCIKKKHGWNCTLWTFQMKALLRRSRLERFFQSIFFFFARQPITLGLI